MNVTDTSPLGAALGVIVNDPATPKLGIAWVINGSNVFICMIGNVVVVTWEFVTVIGVELSAAKLTVPLRLLIVWFHVVPAAVIVVSITGTPQLKTQDQSFTIAVPAPPCALGRSNAYVVTPAVGAFIDTVPPHVIETNSNTLES